MRASINLDFLYLIFKFLDASSNAITHTYKHTIAKFAVFLFVVSIFIDSMSMNCRPYSMRHNAKIFRSKYGEL